MPRIYIDGIFDLFHKGHLESLIKAKNILNEPEKTTLIVGVVCDKDATDYKRKPIINEQDRKDIINSIKYVDEVIFPCPLIVTMEFIKHHKIDLVVHGFTDDNDRHKQQDFYKTINNAGYFKEIEYYKGISTSELIKTIKNIT